MFLANKAPCELTDADAPGRFVPVLQRFYSKLQPGPWV